MAKVPVDTGWAWCVLFGATLNMFFVIGGLKSMGIVFVHVLEHFEASATLTSWMFGLMSFGLSVMAPVAQALGQRYTYRVVVFAGGGMFCLGFFLAAFAPNIYYVVCVLGGFIGISNGMIFTPCLVMVGQYFSRYRSISMGILMAGGSMGQLVIPILMQFLLDELSFFGAMLVYSALVGQCIVGACFLRPHSFYTKQGNKTNKEEKNEIEENDVIKRRKKTSEGEKVKENGAVERVASHDQVASHDHGMSTMKELNSGGANTAALTPSGSVNSLEFNSDIQHNLTSTPMCFVGNDVGRQNKDHDGTKANLDQVKEAASNHELNDSTTWPLVTRDETEEKTVIDELDSEIKPLRCDSEENKLQPKQSAPDKSTACTAIKDAITNMFDPTILRLCLFWLYIFAVCNANSGYLLQFLFIPPYGKEIGISKQHVAWVLSITGIVDLCARLLGGVLNNLQLIKTAHFISISLFLTSVSVIICLFFQSFASLIAHSVLLGLLGGMYISLYPVVLVEFIGMELYPKAFALCVMGMGILTLPLPTIFGEIRDVVGSFAPVFWVCASMMGLGAILFLFEPVARKMDQNKLSNDTKGPEMSLTVQEEKA